MRLKPQFDGLAHRSSVPPPNDINEDEEAETAEDDLAGDNEVDDKASGVAGETVIPQTETAIAEGADAVEDRLPGGLKEKRRHGDVPPDIDAETHEEQRGADALDKDHDAKARDKEPGQVLAARAAESFMDGPDLADGDLPANVHEEA